jgi:hypothetical protein
MNTKLPVFEALGHSVSSTVNNLGFAFHVSWPWMLLRLPITIASALYFLTHPIDPQKAIRPDVLAIIVVEGAIALLIFASIAVNWHRYILRDEVPVGWQRLRLDGDVFRYFGNTLLIVLLGALLGITGVAPILIAALFSAISQTLGAIVAIPLFIAWGLFVIGTVFRWSVKLVAVALGRHDFGVADAWRVTAENHMRIVGLYVLVFLLSLLLAGAIGIVTYLLANNTNVAAVSVLVAVQLAINWISSIWNVTLLTSLYGYFVEKRDF